MKTYDWGRVRDCMRTDITEVDGKLDVLSALKVMRETGTASLIVKRRDENDELGLLLFSDIAKEVIARDRAGCHRDHPLPLGGQFVDRPVPVPAVERLAAAIGCTLLLAHRYHRLGRALHVDTGFAVMVVMQHRHVAMRGVERDLVGATPALKRLGAMAGNLAGQRHQRSLHGVAFDAPSVDMIV